MKNVFPKRLTTIATLGFVAAMSFYGSLTTTPPSMENLQEVRGTLKSYHYKPSLDPKVEGTTVLVLSDGRRVWTRAVTPSNARAVFPRNGLQIVTRIDPKQKTSELKAYGLWVEGRGQLESAEDLLKRDGTLVRYVLPLLGLAALSLLVLPYRSQLNKER